jgi:hypothetical protein
LTNNFIIIFNINVQNKKKISSLKAEKKIIIDLLITTHYELEIKV